MTEIKPKSFWRKPEGVTGAIVLAALLIGGGYLVATSLVGILTFLSTTTGLVVGLLTLGMIIFLAIDPKSRALFNYMYKSTMRWITGLFVQINPIVILKSYVEDLKENLRKMNRQVSKLRGQMHVLKEMADGFPGARSASPAGCSDAVFHLVGIVCMGRPRN